VPESPAAKELNIRFGSKKKKPTNDTVDIEDEIGDIVFTLACLANALDLDLEKGFQNSMTKCYERDKALHEKKD
jgi:NTP pyrophosphatase (non-canonical NTP hydrolase)